jgi:hypothetical protein
LCYSQFASRKKYKAGLRRKNLIDSDIVIPN